MRSMGECETHAGGQAVVPDDDDDGIVDLSIYWTRGKATGCFGSLCRDVDGIRRAGGQRRGSVQQYLYLRKIPHVDDE
jgi:hypothetical protein